MLQVLKQLLGAAMQAGLVGGGDVGPAGVFESDDVDYYDDAGESCDHDCGVEAVPAGAADESGHHRAEGDEGDHENQPAAYDDVGDAVPEHGADEGNDDDAGNQPDNPGEYDGSAEGTDGV